MHTIGGTSFHSADPTPTGCRPPPSNEPSNTKGKEECNPNPTFPLPNHNAPPRQGIVPSFLLRQAKGMRAKKQEEEASEQTKKNQEISDQMRAKRQETYFPPSKQKPESEKQ